MIARLETFYLPLYYDFRARFLAPPLCLPVSLETGPAGVADAACDVVALAGGKVVLVAEVATLSALEVAEATGAGAVVTFLDGAVAVIPGTGGLVLGPAAAPFAGGAVLPAAVASAADAGVGLLEVSVFLFRFTFFFFTVTVAAAPEAPLSFPSDFVFVVADSDDTPAVGPADADFLGALAFTAPPLAAAFFFVGFGLEAAGVAAGLGGFGGGVIPNKRSSSKTLSSGARVETPNFESFTLLACSCPSFWKTSF